MTCTECGLPYTARKIETVSADGTKVLEEVWACWVCYEEEINEDVLLK